MFGSGFARTFAVRRGALGLRTAAVLITSLGMAVAGMPHIAGANTPTALLACSTTQAPPCVFGNFEIDGNSVTDGAAAASLDWDTVAHRSNFTDASGQVDNSFKQGSKEDQQLPSGSGLGNKGWVCTGHSNPNKVDFTSGSVATGTHDNKQYAYISFLRANINQNGTGNSDLDVEFNQSGAHLTNGGCDTLPLRQVGDYKISFITDNVGVGAGGASITPHLFRWNGTGWDEVANSRGVTWEATSNLAPSFTDAGVQPNSFMELAVDLTDTFGTFSCGSPLDIWMHSRASHPPLLRPRTM